MRNTDFNKVVFHSKQDMAGGHYLQNGESILRSETKSTYTDINEVLELYNLKKYIDNDLYLKSWSPDDITNFKTKATEYGMIVGRFMASVGDNNILSLYENTLQNYVHSFWELINNQRVFKRISAPNIINILLNEPHLIHEIITHKNLVDHYDNEIKFFLLTYSQSAEILLSIYEVQDDFQGRPKFIPKNLTITDKENIISNYLDSNDVNLNYVELIQNVRNRNEFKISDKIRLKAKRLLKTETEKILSQNSMKYGVSISFPLNATKLKDGFVDENLIAHYSYSLDFIKQYNDFYTLFRNFKVLFEYVDLQNRINLVTRKSQMGLFERIMGVHSQNEYRTGTSFSLTEMISQSQIFGYSKILSDSNISLESIINFVFTSAFQELYDFADNARFLIPSETNSYFEKVRILAPELESILKQFKLYVEDGRIDFELLQISSAPSAIKDIPSLNKNKYIYFNQDNKEMLGCSDLFFSDQTLLAYVEPFKDKGYNTFFNLLANQQDVKFSNYEEFQKPKLQYLIEKEFIFVDVNDIIKITNPERLWIFKDLHENEFASFYRYPMELQAEVLRMENENIILLESSLFSKTEQSYFNYFLNKSEFTNGLDLRNSYLHGTQANPHEIEKHEYAYFTYLKLLFLTMLKIEDDLFISKRINNP
ncbi:MAG: hypothetical protein HOP30_19235 [Cyclobacteriaceae bacterium]|nr:hypothetical protein [Cyclobacteriaceae bacterium]